MEEAGDSSSAGGGRGRCMVAMSGGNREVKSRFDLTRAGFDVSVAVVVPALAAEGFPRTGTVVVATCSAGTSSHRATRPRTPAPDTGVVRYSLK